MDVRKLLHPQEVIVIALMTVEVAQTGNELNNFNGNETDGLSSIYGTAPLNTDTDMNSDKG
jgi:hypothetical protein